MKVELCGIKKSFGDRTLFTNLDYVFTENKVNVILGESGSGKTTLLNILALFETADEGTVQYDGQVVSSGKASQRRKTIRESVGYVYQDIRLFDELSVDENLRLALRFSIVPRKSWCVRISDLLKDMGLEDAKDKLVGTLSGGEKQRIAIARALACEKKLLLADEPTGALDEENTKNIIHMLQTLSDHGDCTIVVVTHSMLVANAFPDRCWLRDGHLVRDEGEHREG